MKENHADSSETINDKNMRRSLIFNQSAKQKLLNSRSQNYLVPPFDRFALGAKFRSNSDKSNDNRPGNLCNNISNSNIPVHSVVMAAQLYSIDPSKKGKSPSVPPLKLTVHLQDLLMNPDFSHKAGNDIYLQIFCFGQKSFATATLSGTRSDHFGVYKIDKSISFLVPAGRVLVNPSKGIPSTFSQDMREKNKSTKVETKTKLHAHYGIMHRNRNSSQINGESEDCGDELKLDLKHTKKSIRGRQTSVRQNISIRYRRCDNIRIIFRYNSVRDRNAFWKNTKRAGQSNVPVGWNSNIWSGEQRQFDVLSQRKFPKHFALAKDQGLFRSGNNYFQCTGCLQATCSMSFVNEVRKSQVETL